MRGEAFSLDGDHHVALSVTELANVQQLLVIQRFNADTRAMAEKKILTVACGMNPLIFSSISL